MSKSAIQLKNPNAWNLARCCLYCRG